MTIDQILGEIHKLSIEDRLTLLNKIKKFDDPRIDNIKEQLKDWVFTYKNSSTNKSMHITFTKGDYRIICDFIYKNKNNHYKLYYKKEDILQGSDYMELSKVNAIDAVNKHAEEIIKQGYTIQKVIPEILTIMFEGKYKDVYSCKLTHVWRYGRCYHTELDSKFWSVDYPNHRVFVKLQTATLASIGLDKSRQVRPSENPLSAIGRLVVSNDFADPKSKVVYLIYGNLIYGNDFYFIWEEGQDFVLDVVRDHNRDEIIGTTFQSRKWTISEEIKQEIHKKIVLMKKKLK